MLPTVYIILCDYRLKRTTPTTSIAVPTGGASTGDSGQSSRGVGGATMRGFDVNPNPPHASSYELGKVVVRYTDDSVKMI